MDGSLGRWKMLEAQLPGFQRCAYLMVSALSMTICEPLM